MKCITSICIVSCNQLGVEHFSVTKSGFVNKFLFNILGEKTRRLPIDCYSHQVKLLPAGVEHVSVTKSGFVNKFLFNILGGKNRRLPDEDCYNHQVKLLPAGPLNISVSPKVVLSTNFCSIREKNPTPSR